MIKNSYSLLRSSGNCGKTVCFSGALLLANFPLNNEYMDNDNNKMFRARNIWSQTVRKKQWTISLDILLSATKKM